ncbi:hypothetical protein [Bifidobacterium sp. ESL0732]|uniref:hypothetical protein n=1 Tax=Bifidobacterium sp. ESL0732 TaxID=2983222 RepID=UPI0023F7BA89|nr:hypothetical protein [Bifidobacterium sp. ESL0732]WEV64200.1 hypothetical protein OZX70_00960 [Bifidobacterium sp. ESL0732]
MQNATILQSFSLLSAVGLDCAGGIQFVDEEHLDELKRPEQLHRISEAIIRKRLLELSSSQPNWHNGDEYYYERIELKHWLRLCQGTKLDVELIAGLLKHYAEILSDTFNGTAKIALTDVVKLKISPESFRMPNSSSANARKELVNRIGAGVKRHCDSVLRS